MFNSLQLKRAGVSALFISLLSSYSSHLHAQDAPTNARVESFSGSTTYDGSGAGTAGPNSSFFGFEAGSVNSGDRNSFFGSQAGKINTTGFSNNFFGHLAGSSNTTGSSNSYFGSSTGSQTTTATQNSYFGNIAGRSTTTGSDNAYFGFYTGYSNTTGTRNVFIGSNSGTVNTSGSYNTLVGNRTGFQNVTGSYNVFLGYYAGGQELGSNKLYIANSNTTTPLIYGDFSTSRLTFHGKTSIGTRNFPDSLGSSNLSSYSLYVKGGILTEQLRIRTGWADYVFDDNYYLKDLSDVESYIKQNKHLPNVPSAVQVEAEGLEIGDIARIQQEKIEELTLYLIKQEKALAKQKTEIDDLKLIVQKLVEKSAQDLSPKH